MKKISFLIIITVLSAIFAFSADQTTGYRAFFLGNSFTVNTHYHSEYFAKCAGFTTHSHLCAWAPGMQISSSWGHWARPEASAASEGGGSLCGWKRGLGELTWDRFVIQPFFENQQACIDTCNKFYDFAKVKSPDMQMIVKQVWFYREATSFENGRQPNSVAYYEGIADGIEKAHPESKVYICPTGLVIQELRRLTALGQVPGVAHEADWYDDPIHLSKLGNYADGMTQFITLYKVNPVNFNIPANVSPTSWYGYTINEKTAKKIQEVAWKITSSYARSGVSAGAVDTTPPTAPTEVAASKITSAGITLNWTAAEDAESGIASYSIYQNDVKLPTFYLNNNAVIANLVPNTKYKFSVTANNRAGLSSPQSAEITVETPAPAVPVIGLSLKTATLTLNIAVDKPIATAFTPANADNKGLLWTSSNPEIAIVSADGIVAGKSAGTATVTATACDNTNGVKTATAVITVLPNNAPVAAYKVSIAAKQTNPLMITFDGSASKDLDPRDGIFGWDWDFGDGTPHFYGTNPNHLYEKEGTYTTSLTVLDNNGKFSEKLTKEITLPLPVAEPAMVNGQK